MFWKTQGQCCYLHANQANVGLPHPSPGASQCQVMYPSQSRPLPPSLPPNSHRCTQLSLCNPPSPTQHSSKTVRAHQHARRSIQSCRLFLPPKL
ncbi:hypothetical protein E2C01_033264 [Portunus trituberculatus]|uniref:Uncharacterized protein n=1 Tax=Portunus trituberculatus TaxID=210409 RepID=A0A5B7F2I7_PORTR|nr:hypothetical protein [Portunus trituberculatus]